MNNFDYIKVKSANEAVDQINGTYVAGGTNLIDIWKYNLTHPQLLVDVSGLDHNLTELDSGVSLGAAMTNADTAYHAIIGERYPLLSKAILAGASAQIRNMATNGGNLLQRTRCYYFYDSEAPCNKRVPGSGCSAINGYHRIHAILGASEQCIAVFPSDMCVALAALDGVVNVKGPAGERKIYFSDFHRLPGQTPELDNTLQPGELIVSIDLPGNGFAKNYSYLKLRDRHSYAFALVSVATGLELDGDNIKEARIALGGVAHKPWRVPEAEDYLRGKPATPESFSAAAEIILNGAVGLKYNAFKIELAKRAIVRNCMMALHPESQLPGLNPLLNTTIMAFEPSVGKPINRLEGKLKVTGSATYAGDYNVPDLLHGYVVNSAITKGKIISIDSTAAKALPGVIEVFTHENRPHLAWFDLQYADMDAPPGKVFKPLSSNEIVYNGQPIALVVAEDFETARYASTLIHIAYEAEPFETCLDNNLEKARDAQKGLSTALKPPPPPPTGDFSAAFDSSPIKVSATYRHGVEHHNPLELFATTTIYEGDGKLTIYDKTQGTINSQLYIANIFGLHFKNVRVLAPFVGGGFGSGLRPQYQLFLCVLASLELKRHVRLTLDRKQMYSFGHRPSAIQKLRFSTDEQGKLTGLNHSTFSETSQFEDYAETVSEWSHKLYPAPNTLFEYKLVPLDVFTPIDMRAPGGSTALHAVECTMDKLAYALQMDPLQLRLINYAEKDPSTGKPFTSKALRECYKQAAEAFGWDKRNPEPGSMSRGNKLVGYGMATGMWDAFQFPAHVEAMIDPNGKLIVNNAVTDIGTGTLTVMTQVAADELGLAMEDVTFGYGDSKKPFSMFQGGSAATASTGVGIVAAAKALKKKLLRKAKSLKDSPFKDAKDEDVVFEDKSIYLKSSPEVRVAFTSIIAANKGRAIKTTNWGTPHMLKLRKYTKATHSACFVEVEVDKELKTITVTRAVTAVAAGRIINLKTARSQVLGSMVWGIGKALQEETIMDEQLGKYVNPNLSEYHLPVHADINDLQVIFADEKDDLINELGIKGVGEIGIVAMPSAIANAIFNATGKRVDRLPIHFDELL